MKKLLFILGALILSFLFFWSDAGAALPTPAGWFVNNEVQMYLEKSVTPSQTLNITISAPSRNGDTIEYATTSGGMLRFSSGRRQEDIYYSSGSVNTTTKVITLYGVIRDVCPNQPSVIVTCNDGKQWNRGSVIELNNDARLFNWKPNINTSNTMTGSGRLTSDQTTQTYLTPTNVTTAQRDAFTDKRTGDIIHNSTLGIPQFYDGSSWLSYGTGALVNATTAVRGVVTLASSGSALAGSGQGIGGSFNVLQSLYTTASGGLSNGTDAGFVMLVDNTGFASGNLLGQGPTATTFLRGDQTWADPLSTSQLNFGNGSDGALSVPSGTTSIDCGGLDRVYKQYTSVSIATGATLNAINPADDGCVVYFAVQGDVDIYGTFTVAGKGALGGSGSTSTVAGGTGTDNDTGSVGVRPFNALAAVREGAAGIGTNDGGNNCEGSGGGGGASVVTAGVAGTAADSSGGGIAGVIPTFAQAILASSGYGGAISPGAGGGGGGSCVEVDTSTGGTGHSSTGGDGGRGGGSFVISAGGNLNLNGTVSVAGGNGEAAGVTITNPVSNYSAAGGGSGGGSAGVGLFVVAGLIHNTGTKTVTGGSVGAVASTANVNTATTGVGGAGAAGRIDVIPSITK